MVYGSYIGGVDMDLDKFHNILKKIKERNIYYSSEFDVRNEVMDIFREVNFIQDSDVRFPYILIKTKLPKNFLKDFLQIQDDIIDTNFSCLDYNQYLIDCDKFYEEDNNTSSKCDIIDIAEEEMKNIDSSTIDNEFKKVFTEEYSQKFIDSIGYGNWDENDIASYMDMLNSENIKDIRISDKIIYFKTKGLTIDELAELINVDSEILEKVPIFGKYSFYFIDTSKHCSCVEAPAPESQYDEKELVSEFYKIGNDGSDDIEIIKEIVVPRLESELKVDYVDIQLEDKIIAIGLNEPIFEAKEIVSDILNLNPKIFIDVTTPLGTVLLIDIRRWILEPEFGDDEWYH